MLKNYCHICNQRPPIFLIAKFCARIRILKFGTKNALFECFGQQFRKIIVIFAVSVLEFASLQSLMQKIKILKLGTKSVRFPPFRAGIWKSYCHIWMQPPRICLDVMFGAKIKIFKLEPTTPDLEFWTGIWKWYCYIWNQHPRICLFAKFNEIIKMPKFGTKNASCG